MLSLLHAGYINRIRVFIYILRPVQISFMRPSRLKMKSTRSYSSLVLVFLLVFNPEDLAYSANCNVTYLNHVISSWLRYTAGPKTGPQTHDHKSVKS